MSYKINESGIEVRGSTLNSLVAAMDSISSVFGNQVKERLAENGIADVQADEWYSLQACLEILAEVAETIGDQTLSNMGNRVPSHAKWPPDIDSVDAGLASIDDAYQMNHRGGNIGFYEYEPVDDTEALLTCKNPYPCEFDQGLITGVVEKFSPEGTYIDIVEESDTCRSDGGDTCVYRVSW